jgi:hypothetical protein
MTQRLHRDRFLPEGYQFGDARDRRDSHAVAVAESFVRNNPTAPCQHPGNLTFNPSLNCYECGCGARFDWQRVLRGTRASLPNSWRAPHENAAERLRDRARTRVDRYQRDYETECDTEALRHDHAFVHYNPVVHADFCACGARRDRSWNVIEGDPD